MGDLQGGFVFLVENSTGFLVASSDPNVSVVSEASGVSEKVKPIDSTSRLIRGATVNLAPTGQRQILKNALVEGEVDAVDYFFQCFLFEKNGLNLVGVYAVPTSIILGDTAANARIGSVVNFTVTVIARGRTSPTDINFYFVHWFTDLAGAEVFSGKPWPGAEKITTKFPVKVLAAFLDSFGFVDGLATKSEVQVLEEYLADRWQALGQAPLQTDHTVALQRLTLMAQGFEQDAIHAFHALCPEDQLCLTEELARSGHRTQFQYAPVGVRSRE